MVLGTRHNTNGRVPVLYSTGITEYVRALLYGDDRRRSGGARPSRRRDFHQPHSEHTALAADNMSPARAHLLGPLSKGSLLLQHHGVCNELALRVLHQAIKT